MKLGLVMLVLSFAGCGTPPPKGPEPPPLICKTPGAAPSPWFVDATAEMGLTGLGTGIQAADLDGDGFPDLIASIAHLALREVPGGPRYHFVFMNRPDPADAQKRVFVDTTPDSGLLATRDGAGGRGFSQTNLGDLDNDGDIDAIACPGSLQPEVVDPCGVFLNDGTGRFELAPASDLENAGLFQSNSGALLDYDRDGILDFWPGAFDSQPLLFRGQGDGRFVEVSASVGLPQVSGDRALHLSFRRTFGVTACDLDGDGDQDVILADYGREANQVWRNDGATFTEIGQMLGVAFDDRMDYSDDLSYQCYCKANPGVCPATVVIPTDCSFTRGWAPGESDQPWRLGGNTFSIACGDIDDDGDLDLMTAEIRHGDVGSASDPSELVINPGGLQKFLRPGNMATGLYRPHTGIAWNEGDMMPVMADIDFDGRKDIYLTSSDYPGNHGWLWRQKPDGTFEDITTPSGGGHKQIHGVALVDVDGDGDLDLLAGTSTARGVARTNALAVYRNVVGQDQNWLKVRLVGAGSNRSAIGAQVRVSAGGRTQLQEVSGGYGHNSITSDLWLAFGLGTACTADAVEVRWPDGAATRATFKDVRANYRIELREGSPDVTYLR